MLLNTLRQCCWGIEQGEKLSDTGFSWIGDIYRLSGSDWTVAGQINNPYLNAIRSSELIADWKAQGLSDEKIQEKPQKDSTLGGLIAPVDVKNILNLVDNGASKEDLAKTATGIALGKVLQGKREITVVVKEVQYLLKILLLQVMV